MIYGNIKYPNASWYPKALNRVLDYLRSADLQALPLGRIEIDGDMIYGNVAETDLLPRSEKQAEFHEKYIDVHYVIQGEETDYYFNRFAGHAVADNRLKESDLAFLAPVNDLFEGRCVVRPGDFAVFFPQDAHTPACGANAGKKIRKIIFKIDAALL